MLQNTESDNQKNSGSIDWAEVILFLSSRDILIDCDVDDLVDRFASVTVMGPGKRPGSLTAAAAWCEYQPGKKRVDLWNDLLEDAQAEWVLFVEDDEKIQFDSFPTANMVSGDKWYPFLIQHTGARKEKQYYQLRLVPSGHKLFDGKDLPDCTRHIVQSDITFSEYPVIVKRETNPVEHVDPDVELSMQQYAPQIYLVQGERYINESKYVLAAAQYRSILKMEKLLPFDRLGAVNGLASCLTEQYKWPEAMTLAQKAVAAEPQQRLPYLIQFKIFQLNKQWDKAIEVLSQYLDLMDYPSEANFDKGIGKEETLLNLAELSLKAGHRKDASSYLERLFTLKGGEVEHSFTQRLLVLSVELDKYERATFFFDHMFAERIPEGLSADEEEELSEYMTMFMKKGWYQFAAEVYNQLYHADPTNNEYKRRLIVSLSKTNRLERARQLIAS